ncbi:Fur-regulated basic protein FbpA [Metabacillus malikii]|uniref:UDP-3-O-acyl-N-acetylglucosamine deacetylase n=1 Tax=Metabacillus malikii TaxID=1504265 RepID=A0ABT9ZCW7_9BACI|nr:Fur-regulated basic protein FbpA [Metabacillus malikii]MDQ0230109.1 UDP-3-O-acyl-N-acetylglucosamine deacetylase [Metabacillus malikii]
MTKLRKAVNQKKEKLIHQLLSLGIYKKEDNHLYELPLSEIELEYHKQYKSQSVNKQNQQY